MPRADGPSRSGPACPSPTACSEQPAEHGPRGTAPPLAAPRPSHLAEDSDSPARPGLQAGGDGNRLLGDVVRRTRSCYIAQCVDRLPAPGRPGIPDLGHPVVEAFDPRRRPRYAGGRPGRPRTGSLVRSSPSALRRPAVRHRHPRRGARAGRASLQVRRRSPDTGSLPRSVRGPWIGHFVTTSVSQRRSSRSVGTQCLRPPYQPRETRRAGGRPSHHQHRGTGAPPPVATSRAQAVPAGVRPIDRMTGIRDSASSSSWRAW